ncbi:MAG: hypothetical protein ACFCUV_07535 [Rivularia sp. (in: cyanobacteria)]
MWVYAIRENSLHILRKAVFCFWVVDQKLRSRKKSEGIAVLW